MIILTIIKLAVGQFIPLWAGWSLCGMLSHKNPLPLRIQLALSYGLGAGLLSLWMFALGILHIPFSQFTIGFPLLGFSLICLIKSISQKTKVHLQNIPSTNTWLTWILLFYITINITMIIWQALNIPVYCFDELATIAFKAKIFFYEKTLPELTTLPHSPYPLMLPFLQSWVALSLGEWNNIFIKIPTVLCFLSFLLLQYDFLKQLTSRLHALAGTALLLSANLLYIHAAIAYRDITMMYFNCAAILLLTLWNTSGNSSYLKLSSLMAGLGTFVKLEGTAYLLVQTLVFLMINWSNPKENTRQKLRNWWIFALPSIAICLIFHMYKIIYYAWIKNTPLTEKTQISFHWDRILHIPQMIMAFTHNILMTGNWGFIWPLMAFSLYFSKSNKQTTIIKIALISYIILLFGVGLLTENYIWIFGNSSATTISRLILHFFPLAIFLVVLGNYKDK